MKNKNSKANITWSYVAAVLFYLSTVLNVITGIIGEKKFAMAIVWFILGTACLVHAIILSKKANAASNKE